MQILTNDLNPRETHHIRIRLVIAIIQRRSIKGLNQMDTHNAYATKHCKNIQQRKLSSQKKMDLLRIIHTIQINMTSNSISLHIFLSFIPFLRSIHPIYAYSFRQNHFFPQSQSITKYFCFLNLKFLTFQSFALIHTQRVLRFLHFLISLNL